MRPDTVVKAAASSRTVAAAARPVGAGTIKAAARSQAAGGVGEVVMKGGGESPRVACPTPIDSFPRRERQRDLPAANARRSRLVLAMALVCVWTRDGVVVG